MMVVSAASYRSKAGDVLDAIVWRHYGRQDARIVETVLQANPGLADLGPVLPAGQRVILPPIADPAPREGVRLWS